MSQCCSVTWAGEGSEEYQHNGRGGTSDDRDIDRRGKAGASDRTRQGDGRVMDRGMTDQVTMCWWRTPSYRVGSKDPPYTSSSR